METNLFDLKTSDGLCDCYSAFPKKDGKYPGVFLFMDAFGLRSYLFEMAQKLASHGYYVFVPNVLYRLKRSPLVEASFPLRAEQMPEIFRGLRELLHVYKVEDSLRDMAVFLKHLKEQPQVQARGFAATGYCLGGRIALMSAAGYPDQLLAVASFHAGNLATDNPESPHHSFGKIKAEIYIGHADNDSSMPAEQIERVQDALLKTGARFKAELYSGAAHGFTMMDLPAYNEQALARHWQNLLTLLGRNFTLTK